MVKNVYAYYNDKLWLKGAYIALDKEYNFWMKNRITDIGLNQYGFCTCPDEDIHVLADGFSKRLGYRPDMTEKMLQRIILYSASAVGT